MPKFPIVGMQFRVADGIPAPTIMSLLPPGSPLYLQREPGNPHDSNAIQVWIKGVASVIPESLDDIKEACVDKDGTPYECPDLSSPLMLGFIKAKTISDDVQGSDVLAPRIDAMIAEGLIENESVIPCELVYGESGRPALRILEGKEPDLDAATAAEFVPVGGTYEGIGTEDISQTETVGFSEDFEKDAAFLNGDDQLEGVEELSEEDLEGLEDELDEEEAP
jgi:hypothetical protein